MKIKIFFQLSCATIVLLSLLHSGAAQVPFPRSCPKVSVFEQLDLDAYMGVWYEYSKYPFIFEVGKKCMYARYEIIDNKTISVINVAVNRFTDRSSNVTGTAKVIAPGQLAVVFSEHQNEDKANYLVLGSDYESYAVVYSCTNVTAFMHAKTVWILTRERKPSNKAIDAAKNIMVANDLSQAFLIDTMQDNCTDLNSRAAIADGDTQIDSAVDLEAMMNGDESNILDMA